MNLLKKRNLLVLSVLLLSVFLSDCSCGKKTTKVVSTDKTVQISANPASAEIFANGLSIGYGNATIKIREGEVVSVNVVDPRYNPMSARVFNYTTSTTAASFPSAYFDLTKVGESPSYKGTSEASYANKFISLVVKNGRTEEEAFSIIHRSITSYFDNLEESDKNAGYFRTAWVGTKWPDKTTRVRVVITIDSKDPLSYRMKFISETAKPNTEINEDSEFTPYNRIPNKYNGFYEELLSKLKN